ncbi:hypothetical protein ACFFQW_29635 [Umezawaea endophytica]|uniref:Uncharacterized protein n=1 Tax=Umezawaea endophytica TaxID=1654476 RepID=A0A9X2VEM1_9PSEU|nr:hypothetical protein [Umezawaea endophytica]MCS7475278.1 hypothetical protein [Umezawaea endophytica]
MIALVLGDFRDRVRRPAYAATLLAAALLGYLAVPASDSRWAIMQLGPYRGLYTSAYVGMATALASTLWLMLGGFYVVRNTIARDERTNVGLLLASTPLRTPVYLVAKLLGNVLVLTSMLVVLAGTALVMQVARGESTSVDLGALLLPFAVVAFPAVVLTASAALFWELTPVLKTGSGNVIWFFCWMVLALGGQSPSAPLGGLGVSDVVESLGADMAAKGLDVTGGEFSLGLTALDAPLTPFEWSGFTPGAGFLLSRLLVMGVVVALALLPAVWFTRFDPALDGGVVPEAPDAVPVPAESGAFYVRGGLKTVVRRGSALSAFPRLLVGEVRVLLQGVSRWWWIGLALVAAVTVVVPIAGVSRVLLPAAWIWPVLLWSRLGTQRYECDVQSILAPYPSVRWRAVAEWLAGVLLTAGTGAAAAIRMVVAGDPAGVAAWVAAVLFIPALAFSLGSLSRTHRVFQAGYVPVWYAGVSGLPVLDLAGALRAEDGTPLGPPAPLLAALGIGLVVAVVALSGRRLR